MTPRDRSSASEVPSARISPLRAPDLLRTSQSLIQSTRDQCPCRIGFGVTQPACMESIGNVIYLQNLFRVLPASSRSSGSGCSHTSKLHFHSSGNFDAGRRCPSFRSPHLPTEAAFPQGEEVPGANRHVPRATRDSPALLLTGREVACIAGGWFSKSGPDIQPESALSDHGGNISLENVSEPDCRSSKDSLNKGKERDEKWRHGEKTY